MLNDYCSTFHSIVICQIHEGQKKSKLKQKHFIFFLPSKPGVYCIYSQCISLNVRMSSFLAVHQTLYSSHYSPRTRLNRIEYTLLSPLCGQNSKNLSLLACAEEYNAEKHRHGRISNYSKGQENFHLTIGILCSLFPFLPCVKELYWFK